MYDFIVQISAVISLAIIVYMLARALPRLQSNGTVAPQNSLDRFIAKLPLAKIDETLHLFFERILRKAKIVVMKADHFISGYLGRMKQYTVAKESKDDLKEKMEAMTNGDSQKVDINK